MLLNDRSVDVFGEFGKVVLGRGMGGKNTLESITLCKMLAAVHISRDAEIRTVTQVDSTHEIRSHGQVCFLLFLPSQPPPLLLSHSVHQVIVIVHSLLLLCCPSATGSLAFIAVPSLTASLASLSFSASFCLRVPFFFAGATAATLVACGFSSSDLSQSSS